MKIYFGDGEVRLEGITNNISVFDIRYKGVFEAESQLPSSWSMMNNEKRIIGFSLGDYVPELLYTYTGFLIITSCVAVDREYNQYNCYPKLENSSIWDSLETNYEDFTRTPESLWKHLQLGRSPRKTKIHQVNLQTEQGEWFFEDGTSYGGEYHTHGDGQSMTGSKHTKESKNIFRKDGNGKIFKLGEKRPIKKTGRREKRARIMSKKSTYSGGGGGGY